MKYICTNCKFELDRGGACPRCGRMMIEDERRDEK